MLSHQFLLVCIVTQCLIVQSHPPKLPQIIPLTIAFCSAHVNPNCLPRTAAHLKALTFGLISTLSEAHAPQFWVIWWKTTRLHLPLSTTPGCAINMHHHPCIIVEILHGVLITMLHRDLITEKQIAKRLQDHFHHSGSCGFVGYTAFKRFIHSTTNHSVTRCSYYYQN